MSTARAIAAARPEKPWSNSRTNIVKMNRPATIDGMPLMASTSTRVTRASRPAGLGEVDGGEQAERRGQEGGQADLLDASR